MDIEIKYDTAEELALQFNEVNALISHYERETLKMMYKQLWLDNRITQSKEFKEAVIGWMKSNPEEVMAIYLVADRDSYEVDIITFGSVLEEGAYCNFCDRHAKFVENSIVGEIERHVIIDENTGEKTNVSLRNMVSRYEEMASRSEFKNLEIRMGNQVIMYPVIKNEIKKNSNGQVTYGKIFVKRTLALTIKEIIDEAFIINNKEREIPATYRDNVVSISKIKHNVV